MKIFTNKSIGKKIIIALLIVLLFQVVMIKPVQADVVEFGGKLMSPILSLLVSLGDGINDIIGRTLMGANSTLYEVTMVSSWLETLGTILVAVAVAALTIIVIVATAGLAAVALAAVGITATVTIGMGTIIAGVGAGLLAAVWFNDTSLPDNIYLPMYTYSAEEIFKGNILFFDVNYFKEPEEIYVMLEGNKSKKVSEYDSSKDGNAKYYYYLDKDNLDKDGNPTQVKTSNQNTAVILKKTVSTWYNTIRNICLVLMLSVLVYIGIRILLSSVASDKAKYLTMLKDWFIGLCLLFLIHYIMAFSVLLVEKLTDVVKTSVNQNGYAVTMQANDKLEEAVNEEHLNMPEAIQEDGNGTKFLTWPTNQMGKLRLELQMSQYGAQYVGLSICYLILCLFTLYFTIVYMKRVLHMAFLTIISPMVALTYCIDKLNDGQAQGFNKWFKEYIFNLLIQPMHLLLYYILITSAFELASTSTIYSIVALGFMIPAEKLLRSLFGFEKAQTAPALGPAGAMMASSALNQLLNKGKRGKDGENSKGGKSDEEGPGKVPNPRESQNPMDSFLGSGQQGDDRPEGGSDAGLEGGSDTGLDGGDEEERDLLMERYNQEGFGQNTNGEYFNPWTEEYDENYDPHQDKYYNSPDEQEETPSMEEASPQGLPRPQGQPQQNRSNEEQSEEEQPTPNMPSTRGQRALRRIKNAPKNAGRRIKRMGHASIAAQKAAMRNAPRKLKRKIENSHPIRFMAKTAAGAALGTAAGAAGIAIAATTGDPSNVAKIGLAAAATGYSVGSGKVKSLNSPMDDKDVKEVYDVAYNKGEYKQDAMNDYVRNFLKDVKNRNYIEQKFDKKEAKEMLKPGGEIEQYLYNDITDIKDMAAAHKLQQKGVVNSTEEAISVAQLSQMVGSNTNNMTEKKRDEWRARFSNMAGESGVQENQRAAFANKRLSELDKFHDFKR